MTESTRIPPLPESAASGDPLSELRHDLRTPLNQIIGYSEMLEEEAAEGGQTSTVQDLQRIQAAARRLLDVINTRVVGGHVPQAPAPAGATASSTAAAEPRATGRAPLQGIVLVVDDVAENRDMLARRLTQTRVRDRGARARTISGAPGADSVTASIPAAPHVRAPRRGIRRSENSKVAASLHYRRTAKGGASMAMIVADFKEPVTGPDGVACRARACGLPITGRGWQGWIEFNPLDGSPTFRGPYEVVQPSSHELRLWARRLSQPFLEAALARALGRLRPWSAWENIAGSEPTARTT